MFGLGGILKKIKHWNLRYVISKFKLMIYEKKNPNTPWLTPQAIEFLDNWLSSNDKGFEWGSGRSTLWLGKRVKELVSIEHNREWYEKIKGEINQVKINVDYNYCPVDNDSGAFLYVSSIKKYEDGYFDFILIDGKHRDRCAMLSLDKIKKGGIIIIDNAERYIPNSFNIPQSIGPENFKNNNWYLFYNKIRLKRKYWTSNGVWSTLIIFV